MTLNQTKSKKFAVTFQKYALDLIENLIWGQNIAPKSNLCELNGEFSKSWYKFDEFDFSGFFKEFSGFHTRPSNSQFVPQSVS